MSQINQIFNQITEENIEVEGLEIAIVYRVAVFYNPETGDMWRMSSANKKRIYSYIEKLIALLNSPHKTPIVFNQIRWWREKIKQDITETWKKTLEI